MVPLPPAAIAVSSATAVSSQATAATLTADTPPQPPPLVQALLAIPWLNRASTGAQYDPPDSNPLHLQAPSAAVTVAGGAGFAVSVQDATDSSGKSPDLVTVAVGVGAIGRASAGAVRPVTEGAGLTGTLEAGPFISGAKLDLWNGTFTLWAMGNPFASDSSLDSAPRGGTLMAGSAVTVPILHPWDWSWSIISEAAIDISPRIGFMAGVYDTFPGDVHRARAAGDQGPSTLATDAGLDDIADWQPTTPQQPPGTPQPPGTAVQEAGAATDSTAAQSPPADAQTQITMVSPDMTADAFG